jgi:hypothetical protein
MSDQLDEDLAQAFLVPLTATGIPLVDDERIGPDMPPRYFRAYTVTERPADAAGNALRGLSTTWTTRCYVHHIGESDTAVRALGMQSRTALLNQRPTVTGRSCGPIRQEAEQPPRRLERTGPMLLDLVVVYRMASTG